MTDVRSGRGRRVAIAGLTQEAVPVWSPDGRTLAFYGTASPAPTFVQAYGVWTVATSGGRPRQVAPNVAAFLPVGQQMLAWTDE